MREFKSAEPDIGSRADVFVARQYPEFSRSSLSALFDMDSVSVLGKPIKPSYKIRTGDKLAVEDELINRQPEAIELPILYEDKDVIVIDKPAGVLTHSKGALNQEATVASFIEPKLDKDLVGNRAGIVHRLDRQTSGVIIAAKNQATLSWLQKQFSARKTKKTYLAIVEGLLDPPEAIIDAPIARNPKKPQTFYVNSAGKPSQTQYKLLKSFQKGSKTYSEVEMKPFTGRTHQLRVHMAYVKHPIVGDHVYGQDGPHMLLHAAALELTLPNRSRQTFTAPPPAYLTDFKRQ
jgi:23S rRNA pseudouridine1911/1915/1917 synthase